ncbi:MAG: YitT family protein, partial [Nanoarchaeota archaeon]|nr:YitT family protein [Nanoarchaeota archaeon]
MTKKWGNFKITLRNFKEYFFILLGITITGFGLKGFLIPNGFIDGGVTGISLLIHFLTPIPVSILIFVINLPFILLAAKQVNKLFAIKTFIAVLGLSICLWIVDYPVITSDKLLISVFGGFLLGAGIGLSVRGGSVLDGTEVLSVYLSRKLSMSVGEILFLFNIIIFSFAAVLLSIEVALYSILIYLTAFKTLDFIVTGIEEYIGIVIISEKSKEIRKKLIHDLKKGVTIYKGKGGYSEEDSRAL